MAAQGEPLTVASRPRTWSRSAILLRWRTERCRGRSACVRDCLGLEGWFGTQPLTSFIYPLQTLDVELDHFQHGFRNSLGPLPIGILHHFPEHGGRDLPGEPVAIFQPPRPDSAANFGLIVALHYQRYGMIKSVECPALIAMKCCVNS
jgi:hypothetical protein